MPIELSRFGPVARLVRLANRLLFVVAAFRVFLHSTEAQEALAFSLAGEQAARSRKLAREQQPYSFKSGDAEVRLGGIFTTEWNDNITLVQEDAIADTILRPQVKADISWPVTTANYLEASVAAGYSKYLSHSEFDRPFILPGSALAFDVFLHDVKLTFEDRLSYEEDATESAVVTGTAKFGGLENLLGLQALADWKDASLSFSYHHLLFVSTSSEFDYLDRTSHQFFTRFSLKPRPDLQTGVEAGLTPTAYLDSYLRDNLSYSGGGFVQWTLSPHISLSGRGGAVFYHFDDPPDTPGVRSLPGGRRNPLWPPPSTAASESSSLYFNFEMSHQLRRFLSYSLGVGRDSQLGVNNDLVDQYSARWDVNWSVSRYFTTTANVLFETGKEFGSGQSESFSRLSTGLTANWQWSRRWNARLSWRFITRDSDQPQHGYDDHRVLLEIGYQR